MATTYGPWNAGFPITSLATDYTLAVHSFAYGADTWTDAHAAATGTLSRGLSGGATVFFGSITQNRITDSAYLADNPGLQAYGGGAAFNFIGIADPPSTSAYGYTPPGTPPTGATGLDYETSDLVISSVTLSGTLVATASSTGLGSAAGSTTGIVGYDAFAILFDPAFFSISGAYGPAGGGTATFAEPRLADFTAATVIKTVSVPGGSGITTSTVSGDFAHEIPVASTPAYFAFGVYDYRYVNAEPSLGSPQPRNDGWSANVDGATLTTTLSTPRYRWTYDSPLVTPPLHQRGRSGGLESHASCHNAGINSRQGGKFARGPL